MEQSGCTKLRSLERRWVLSGNSEPQTGPWDSHRAEQEEETGLEKQTRKRQPRERRNQRTEDQRHQQGKG